MPNNSEKSKFNWRSVEVRRERRHETLIQRLMLDDKSIFSFLKDLMVFAAMVGYDLNEKKPLDGETIKITLETYSSDGKDGAIYLLALMEKKDALILKDDNLHDAITIFEQYCNAGLYEIAKWLDENPGDPIGVDTLLRKILEKVQINDKNEPLDPTSIQLSLD